jgi:hypothetical protein
MSEGHSYIILSVPVGPDWAHNSMATHSLMELSTS